MAKTTDINLRTKTIYQVFVRQHSSDHSFVGIINDLDRLQALGVDMLYLLPIHPIGIKSRKGSQGSPYSIMDYLAVHPDMGTMQDFELLIKEAHQRGMKMMMDIVFNHTARDARWTNEHPDWYIRNEKGELANRVGDWSDIADLNFDNKEVWHELEEILFFWAQHVDGFRCDVAPLIPLDFWLEAREKINRIYPDFIWLSESVHPGFIKYLRDLGFECHSDAEMYQAFDILYDYDIFEDMNLYLNDPSKLSLWMDAIERQETIYPKNYIKLRSFENHDQERLRSKVRDEVHFKQMVGLSFFLKGTAFIYAGMEHQITHRPSLFEYDEVPWNPKNTLESFFTRLVKFKKQPIFALGNIHFHHKDKVVILSYQYQNQFVLGIFNLENETKVDVPLIDGLYMNFIDESEIEVKNHTISLGDQVIIIDTLKEHIR